MAFAQSPRASKLRFRTFSLSFAYFDSRLDNRFAAPIFSRCSLATELMNASYSANDGAVFSAFRSLNVNCRRICSSIANTDSESPLSTNQANASLAFSALLDFKYRNAASLLRRKHSASFVASPPKDKIASPALHQSPFSRASTSLTIASTSAWTFSSSLLDGMAKVEPRTTAPTHKNPNFSTIFCPFVFIMKQRPRAMFRRGDWYA